LQHLQKIKEIQKQQFYKDGTPKNNLPVQANDCNTSWHSNASQCTKTIKCLLFGLHSQQKNQGDKAKVDTNNQLTCANDPTPAGILMSPIININQPLEIVIPTENQRKTKRTHNPGCAAKNKNNNQYPASYVLLECTTCRKNEKQQLTRAA